MDKNERLFSLLICGIILHEETVELETLANNLIWL